MMELIEPREESGPGFFGARIEFGGVHWFLSQNRLFTSSRLASGKSLYGRQNNPRFWVTAAD
jgi:hypothetical protein